MSKINHETVASIDKLIAHCSARLDNLMLMRANPELYQSKVVKVVDAAGKDLIEGWRFFLLSGSKLWMVEDENNVYFRDLNRSVNRDYFQKCFTGDTRDADFSTSTLHEGGITLSNCCILKGFHVNSVVYYPLLKQGTVDEDYNLLTKDKPQRYNIVFKNPLGEACSVMLTKDAYSNFMEELRAIG